AGQALLRIVRRKRRGALDAERSLVHHAVRIALQVDELSLDDVTDHRAAAGAEVADGGELLRAGEPQLRGARRLRSEEGVQGDARSPSGREHLQQVSSADGHRCPSAAEPRRRLELTPRATARAAYAPPMTRVTWTKYLGLDQFPAGIIAESVSSNFSGFSSNTRPM